MPKRKRRFEIRKRKRDGKFIRWEQYTLSELGILPTVEVDGKTVPGYDHLTWVITGVYHSRGAAFSAS